MSELRLADLVAPWSVREFLHSTYGREWAYFPGSEDRFRNIFSWDALNDLLSNQRFESPRLRISRLGEVVPDSEYTESVNRIFSPPYKRILTEKILHQLRNGATLTFDHAEQANNVVRGLAMSLEAELRARVYVDIFASWAPIRGFDLHWDDLDVFTLQLSGRKHWTLFEPTRKWPLHDDVVENPRPVSPSVCDIELKPGDVLYIPHGWWHSVTTTEGPALHLAIGVEPETGVDFLVWLADEAKRHEIFRRRMPRFADRIEQRAHLSSMRALLASLVSSDDILDQFFTTADGRSHGFPAFNFPDILDSESSALLARKGAQILLVAPRATVNSVNDEFELSALGHRWTFPVQTKPLIDVLLARDGCTVGEALSANVGVDEERSAFVLLTLLRAGVIGLR